MSNKYYDEINKALASHESYKPYHPRSMEWIANRITWCWKWKKISQQEMEELSIRATNIFERI